MANSLNRSATGKTRGLGAWVLAQVWLALRLTGQMLLVGLVQAIWRRVFHWRAFAAGLAVMLFGLGGVAAVLDADSSRLHGAQDMVLWGGVFFAMAMAGLVTGRVGRRLGFWELYLATLVTLGVVVVHLAKGWHILLGFGPGETETYFELLGAPAPGIALLGPMWPRLVGFAAVAGFLLAVVGGSLALLLYSPGGRRDARFGVEWFVAARHLLSRQRGPVAVTAVVAVIGIALGVAALLVVTAVMSGYQQDIQDKILSTNAHFLVQKYGLDFTEYPKVEAEALKTPGVLAASPFTFNEAMLAAGDKAVGVLIKGVDPTTAGQVTDIERNLCREMKADGTCVRYDEADARGQLAAHLSKQGKVTSILIGAVLYKRLKVPVGATVTLTTPVGLAGAQGNAPKRIELRLGGVFRSGLHDFDARLVYTDLGTSQQLMGMGGAVNGIEFRVADPSQVDRLSRHVLRAVGGYPYRSVDWRELNAGIFTALKLQKIVMALVLAFIVIVAAFNIASTLFMAVVEKAHEIGVLKSMGARDATIMKVFVLEGWVVGLIGTALGVALGLGLAALVAELKIPIAADVYMVESLKVQIRPFEVGLTAFVALAISHLATIYPALKAARQSPVDAMRYE